jgi:hypothetical protein
MIRSRMSRSAPDWVMLGWSPGDREGVILFASDQLTYGELEIKRDYYQDFISDRVVFVPPPSVSMRAEMRDVIMIEAATYAEALAKLAGRWKPPEPQRPAITSGRREIRP